MPSVAGRVLRGVPGWRAYQDADRLVSMPSVAGRVLRDAVADYRQRGAWFVVSMPSVAGRVLRAGSGCGALCVAVSPRRSFQCPP